MSVSSGQSWVPLCAQKGGEEWSGAPMKRDDREKSGDQGRKGPGSVSNAQVLACLVRLYSDLLVHDGFGEIRLEVRILKRGQKEVIIHCGKQYRFVVDFHPGETPEDLRRCGICMEHIQ